MTSPYEQNNPPCSGCGALPHERCAINCPEYLKRVGWSHTEQNKHDAINPKHYEHPSGIDCILITEHMNFCIGNAIKYLWRAGRKGEMLEDLKKARWYVDREIARLEKA